MLQEEVDFLIPSTTWQFFRLL